MDLGDSAEKMEIEPTGLKVIDKFKLHGFLSMFRYNIASAGVQEALA